MYNGYKDFEECEFCEDKTTSKGCFNCKYFKIKNAIKGLNEYINTRIDFETDLLFINENYKQYIKKYSNINLVPNKMVEYTSYICDDSTIAMVIDKRVLYDNDYLEEMR